MHICGCDQGYIQSHKLRNTPYSSMYRNPVMSLAQISGLGSERIFVRNLYQSIIPLRLLNIECRYIKCLSAVQLIHRALAVQANGFIKFNPFRTPSCDKLCVQHFKQEQIRTCEKWFVSINCVCPLLFMTWYTTANCM